MQTDPEMLAMLEEEEHEIRRSSNRTARLKLNKGQEALVRVLPAKLGKKKSWWTRTAKHWLGRTSVINCLRKTSEAFGGDPDYACPLCALAHKYNESDNKRLSDAAYQLSARVSFDIFLLVKEIDGEAPPRDMRTTAQMYTLYPSGMEELLTIYKRKMKREVDITDVFEGCDIFFKRGKAGLTMTVEESCPLFNIADEAKLEAAILATMESIRFKAPTAPDEEQLDEFVEKAKDYLKRKARGEDDEDEVDGNRSRGGSSRSRHRDDEEDKDEISIPRKRTSSREPEPEEDQPAARKRPVQADPEDELDMSAPKKSEPPAVRTRLSPPPARRTATDSVDENDDVADERREHAPATEGALPDNEEAPPEMPVNVKGTSLRERIRSGIAKTEGR